MEKSKNMTDDEAMDEIERFMIDHDPTLTPSLPNWVWDLTSLIDDVLIETGRS